MKKYLLDTDTIIYFLKGRRKIKNKIEESALVQLHTSVINCAELLYGAHHSDYPSYNLKIVNALISNINIIELNLPATKIFGQLKAKLKKSGQLIADMDLLIASIAIAGNYVLISNNIKHFVRIPKLKIENWNED